MGVNCVRTVPCDEEGRMDVSALDEMITAAKAEVGKKKHLSPQ